MIEKIHENHPESHCPDPNHVGCVMTQKFLSPARGWVFDTSVATMDGLASALSLLLPFMSTWFSNRSSDRVTQRTSMLESTSELLICFRNTWNWSGGQADGGGGLSAKDGQGPGHAVTAGGTHLPWPSCCQQEDRSSEGLGALPSPPNKQPQQELNQIFRHHVQCFLHQRDCCHVYFN